MLKAMFLLCAVLVAQALPVEPRIEAILKAPEGERLARVERLLSEARTPLITPEGRSCLATFLWRGTKETAIVSLIADFASDSSTQKLARIPGTDVWYGTYRLPADSLFYYRIASADQQPPIPEESTWLYKVGQSDPLNPEGITIRRTQTFSFARMPVAPKVAVYEPSASTPKGTFEPRPGAFGIQSKKLGMHRTWLYSPAKLRKDRPCNLILFLDGSGRFQLIPSVAMLDNMIASGELDQTIAVYTDSPDRDRDLSCSDDYLRFLTDELLPWVSDKFKVRFTPQRTLINGASLGGLFSAYAVLRRPDVFGNALMQSPSLWWHPSGQEPDWLTRQFLAAPKVKGRFFVSPGTFEKTAADPEATGILFSSRWFCDVLKAKGVDAKLREVHGGHDPLCWQVSLPEGLRWGLGTRH